VPSPSQSSRTAERAAQNVARTSSVAVTTYLQIVATLAALPDGDALSFTRLQEMIGLTPGNLITHLRKLEDADYLTTDKTGNGPASRTSVALTLHGRAALDSYTETLRGLLNGL
jgi:DNA-binding MarR family transcriptional regulator